MDITWLSPDTYDFPNPETARSKDVIAAGGDMSPERLLAAYKKGIFPWYNEGEPILWWSPDPRMVLFPDELKISKSMRPVFNSNKFHVTYNVDFQQVMNYCRNHKRIGLEEGSWINDEMIASYTALHKAGYAHSVEVWQDDTLVAGLYGIAIGRVFFGESMFTKVSNGSKFGFITFVTYLKKLDFKLIDCQQETTHLTSLGGRVISRKAFMDIIRENENAPQILI